MFFTPSLALAHQSQLLFESLWVISNLLPTRLAVSDAGSCHFCHLQHQLSFPEQSIQGRGLKSSSGENTALKSWVDEQQVGASHKRDQPAGTNACSFSPKLKLQDT